MWPRRAHTYTHAHTRCKRRGGRSRTRQGAQLPLQEPLPRRQVAGVPSGLLLASPGPEVRSSTGMGTKALEVLKAEAQPAPAQCPTKGSSRPLGSLGRFPPGRKPIFQNIPSVIQHGPQTANLTEAEQILPHPGSGPGTVRQPQVPVGRRPAPPCHRSSGPPSGFRGVGSAEVLPLGGQEVERVAAS